MEKVFEDFEYGNDLANEVSKWIESKTIDENGGCKIFRPIAVVKIFDQNGDEIKDDKLTSN